MAKPRVERKLLFVDCETTGLDPLTHEILEIAGILTSPDGNEVLNTFEYKLKPLNLSVAHPDALRINGYSEREWSDDKCTDPKVVSDVVLKNAADTILVGQNVGFDEAFVREFLRRNGRAPTWHYHKVDTMNLAWPLFCQRKIDYFNLDALCDFCKVERPKVHRAMADIKATRAVYLTLMKHYA